MGVSFRSELLGQKGKSFRDELLGNDEPEDILDNPPSYFTGLRRYIGSILGDGLKSSFEDFKIALRPGGHKYFGDKLIGESARIERERDLDIGKAFVSDIAKTGRNIKSGISSAINTPFSEIPEEIWGAAKELMASTKATLSNVGSLPAGMASMLIETPLEALTGRQNVDGTPVPMSPQEQANAIQQTLGTIVNIYTTRKIAGKINPGATLETAPGLLERGITGQLYKSVLANTVGSIPGGFAQGAIGGLGDDDQGAQIIANTLANIPLGITFGLLEVPFARRSQIKLTKQGLDKTAEQIANLGLLQELSVLTDDSIESSLSKVDAVATTDDLLDSVIKKNGKLEQTTFLRGEVSDEYIQRLKKEGPSRSKKPEFSFAGLGLGQVARSKYRPNFPEAPQTSVLFIDDFDQASYWISTKDKDALLLSALPAKSQRLVNKIVDKTGVSAGDMYEHGLRLRSLAREKIKKGEFRNLTQYEINQLDQEALIAGRKEFNRTPEGGSIVDRTGMSWIRQGDNLTDGSRVYPGSSNELMKIIGRGVKDKRFEVGVVTIDPQPLYSNTELEWINSLRFHKSNGNTIIDNSDRIDPVFARTGYVSGQLLDFDGSRYVVMDLAGSKVRLLNTLTNESNLYNPADLNKFSLVPETITGFRSIDKKVYFDNLYESFKKQVGDIDKVPNVNFSDVLGRFLIENDIDANQAPSIIPFMYSRFSKEVTASEPAIATVVKELEQINDNRIRNDVRYAYGNAASLGLRVEAEGAGIYNVVDAVGRTKLGTVSGLDELNKVIQQMRVRRGYDLDGGNTNGIPSSSVNPGPLDDYKPIYTKTAQWFDRKFGMTGLAIIDPAPNFFASLAGTFKQSGVDVSFTDIVDKATSAKYKIRSQIVTRFKPVIDSWIPFNKEFNKLSEADQAKMADYVESVDGSSILRSATGEERSLGMNMVGQSDKVKSLFKEARKAGDINSAEFVNVINKHNDKNVINLTLGLVQAMKTSSIDPSVVMSVADVISNPSKYIGRGDFARINNLSPEAIKVAGLYDNMINLSLSAFNLDKPYPASVLRQKATFGFWNESNSGILDALERTTKSATGDLIRDLPELSYRYISKMMNMQSGFDESISIAKKEMDGKIGFIQNKISEFRQRGQEKEARSLENRTLALRGKFDTWVQELQGYPDDNTLLTQSFHKLGDKIGIGKELRDAAKDVTTYTYLVNLATQGGRFGLGIRDAYSTLGYIWSAFGTGFARKALSTGLKSDYMDDLVRKGVLPPLDVLDFASPGNLSNPLKREVFQNALEFGYSASGQRLVYAKAAAGVYKTTVELVNEQVKEWQAGKISLKTLSDKVHADVHQFEFQSEFVDRLKQGKTIEAADFLGRANVKLVANIYGNGNNPLGYSTMIGKLFGQYGSWTSNAVQTNVQLMSNGSIRNRMLRLGRLAAYNGMLATAGSYAGVNLWTWYNNPLVMFPGVGPIVQSLDDFQTEAQMIQSGNETTRERSANRLLNAIPGMTGDDIGRMFIPYSYAAQDWLNAVNMAFDSYYTPLQASLRTAGIKPNEDSGKAKRNRRTAFEFIY